LILRALRLVGLPRGDDPDDFVRLAMAVTDDQGAQGRAEPEKDETFFVVGVVRVVLEQCFLIVKHRLGFLERDLVLPSVDSVLSFIPFERKFSPWTYSVTTL
jgi:hypothetical protein